MKRILRVSFILPILFMSMQALAVPDTISMGSYIINMGVTPQTIGNGLKPYGLVYDLVKNYKVPVKWVINLLKAKDGIDFTHNGINYRGGTFVVAFEFRTPAIDAVITSWQAQGVVGSTAISSFVVDLYKTIHYVPVWTLDKQNGAIAANYFVNAGIPASAHGGASSVGWKNPSQLGACDDIFVMPHADPTWATHQNLYDWNLKHKGNIWAACHAVSVMESLTDPFGTIQMNFLSTTGLIDYNFHQPGTPPYSYKDPANPIMQFMNVLDYATDNGSERIFVPNAGGGWLPTTTVAVYDGTQADVPLNSPGPAAVIAYGRGFGDPKRGWVMYEAGHRHHTNGSVAEQVAAQRAFFNYSLEAATDKNETFAIQMNGVGPVVTPLVPLNLSFTVPAWVNLTNYTIQWTSTWGGTFSPNANQQAVTYTPAAGTGPCIITVILTDGCGREFFSSTGTYMNAVLSEQSTGIRAVYNYADKSAQISWYSANNSGIHHFEIQRSDNGKDFYPAGTTPSSLSGGNSSYGFVDTKLIQQQAWYRLKIVKSSGGFTYSRIEMLSIKEKGSSAITLLSNPTNGDIRVEFRGAKKEMLQFQLSDVQGKIIFRQNMNAAAGIQTILLGNYSRLPAGTYVLQARFSSGSTSNHKVVMNR